MHGLPLFLHGRARKCAIFESDRENDREKFGRAKKGTYGRINFFAKWARTCWFIARMKQLAEGDTFTLKFRSEPKTAVADQFKSSVKDDYHEFVFPGLTAVVQET